MEDAPLDGETPAAARSRARQEARERRARGEAEPLTAAEVWRNPRLTFRRLSGLDRSGPPPPQTLRGQPLHPWTVPNAIGYVRLALIPLFLAIAFSSGDGTSAGAAIVFAIVGWSDYADGIAARVTGQYSRLGALMDPFIDRLLVISGVAVCWHYELLPRWALAVLAVRELFALALAQWGLRHGLELKINWWGRLGVWPVMSAPFFALVALKTLAYACLYVGLMLALIASAAYLADALAQRRAQRARTLD